MPSKPVNEKHRIVAPVIIGITCASPDQNGRLLASGTAAEVVAHAALRTWRVDGARTSAVQAALARDEAWLCAPFGNTLHVSAGQGMDLPQWLAQALPDHGCVIAPIATGLEDVFIALTAHAQDNFA